jgi:hypothetical protein
MRVCTSLGLVAQFSTHLKVQHRHSKDMVSTTSTVTWVCVEPMRVESVIAVLEDYPEDIPSSQLADGETHVGRIGAAKVIIARSQKGVSYTKEQRLLAALPTPDTLVITSCVAEQSFGANPGDILIGSTVSHSKAPANVLQRAVEVLNKEIGNEGFWLLSNIPQGASTSAVQCSSRAANGRQREVTNSPRLHYLPDNDTAEPFLGWDGSEKAPYSSPQS